MVVKQLMNIFNSHQKMQYLCETSSLSIKAYVEKVWAEVLSAILNVQGLTKAPQSVSLNEYCYFHNSVHK